MVFDNDWFSRTYRQSIAQYVYPLEAQAAIRARITAAGGTATGSDPRQGRNIGLSSIVAINAREFLVLERDNRGIGVDNPQGLGAAGGPIPALGVVGSKRVFCISLDGATGVSELMLPDDGNLAGAGITPVVLSAAPSARMKPIRRVRCRLGSALRHRRSSRQDFAQRSRSEMVAWTMAERVKLHPTSLHTGISGFWLPPHPLKPHEGLGRRTYCARGVVVGGSGDHRSGRWNDAPPELHDELRCVVAAWCVRVAGPSRPSPQIGHRGALAQIGEDCVGYAGIPCCALSRGTPGAGVRNESLRALRAI